METPPPRTPPILRDGSAGMYDNPPCPYPPSPTRGERIQGQIVSHGRTFRTKLANAKAAIRQYKSDFASDIMSLKNCRFVNKSQRMTNWTPNNGFPAANELPAQLDDYVYDDLPPCNYMRLLILYPGEPGSNVVCTLKIVRTFRHTLPPFEALSYVWGNPELPRRPIQIDDKKLEVTPNLFAALQHLRRGNRTRTLWIDAICINQRNLQERSRQVLLMCKIYSQAKEVVIWLGIEKDLQTDAAFDRLEVLKDTENVTLNVPDLRANERAGLEKIFCQSGYWSRLWILQEVYFASEAHMLCGDRAVPWKILQALRNVAVNDRDPLKVPMKFAWGLFEAKSILQMSLRWLIELSQRNLCTDDRDRVYALLSILPASKREGIKPDYEKAVWEVYLDATRGIIREEKNLSILSHNFASYTNANLRATGTGPITGSIHEIPSWVPDFGRLKGVKADRVDKLYCASQKCPWDPKRYKASVLDIRIFNSQSILPLVGVNWDSITFISPSPANPAHAIKAPRMWLKVLSARHGLHPNDPQYFAKQSVSTFVRTLFRDICYSGGDGSARRMSAADLPAYKQFVADFFNHNVDAEYDPTQPEPMEGAQLFPRLTHLCYELAGSIVGRSFFLTKRGYVGLVNTDRGANVGDRICVVDGSDAPLVLRDRGDKLKGMPEVLLPAKGKFYSFHGTAYVHGLMDGKVYEKIEKVDAAKKDMYLI